MSHLIRQSRAVLFVLAALASVPAAVVAQSPRTFTACYVPAVGAMYLINETGLPSACLATAHVQFTWTEGALADGGATTAKLADGAVTTAKLADGAVTAAKLGADVNAGIITDGSITPAKLSFDPATQAELDNGIATHTHAPSTHAASGGSNTAVGVEALVAPTGHSNTGVGWHALRVLGAGTGNTAVGRRAGVAMTTGASNTAMGNSAMEANVDGNNNTAIGYFALRLSTASNNTALGYQALTGNTIGTANAAVGLNALQMNTSGSNNTGLGAHALQVNTVSGHNTAVGDAALIALSAGGENTALGSGALDDLTDGQRNIALGRNAGALLTTGSDNIFIGHQGAATANNTILIGSTHTRVHLAGVSGVTTDGVAAAVVIDAAGQLGTVSSSRTVKSDIQDMGDASERLMRLRPVTFRYLKPMGDGTRPMQYGLIAEEVAEVYPELVVRDSTGAARTVAYHVLPAMLLNELQRQEREIAELRAAVAELRQAIERSAGPRQP